MLILNSISFEFSSLLDEKNLFFLPAYKIYEYFLILFDNIVYLRNSPK